MEKLLQLVQWLEKCHLTELKMNKFKIDSKILTLQKNKLLILFQNSKMLLQQIMSNKEDGQNGFMDFLNSELIFILLI
jgi:hypothetical protein